MTWTPQTKNSASYTNLDKSGGTVDNFNLLIDSTYKLLIDDTYHLLIQVAGAGISWTNASKNSASWSNIAKN